jgi:hypothetical protein
LFACGMSHLGAFTVNVKLPVPLSWCPGALPAVAARERDQELPVSTMSQPRSCTTCCCASTRWVFRGFSLLLCVLLGSESFQTFPRTWINSQFQRVNARSSSSKFARSGVATSSIIAFVRRSCDRERVFFFLSVAF